MTAQRRRRAALAARLDAERVGRRQHLDDLGGEGRQRVGARHAVIHERAGERLARGAGRARSSSIIASPTPLRDRAMRLAVDDQRIDAAADIVDRGIAVRRARRSRDRSRSRIPRSRWERPDRASRCRWRRRARPPDPDGSGSRAPRAPVPENRSCGCCRGAAKRPSAKATSLGAGIEHECGDRLALGDQRPAAPARTLWRHGASSGRNASRRRADDVGIAHDDVDALDRHRQHDPTRPGRSSSRGPARAGCVPITTLDRPSGSTVISARSRGEPIEDST